VASDRQGGFTLIELLVGMTIFAVVSIAMYQTVFAASRGSDVARSVANTTQEARLGFNRMIRDTREANTIQATSSTSYTIQVDFDLNGTLAAAGTLNTQGDAETLTFAYNPTARTISLSGETLMTGVSAASSTTGPCGAEIFCYVGNKLEYDGVAGLPKDGTVTCLELDRSGVPGVGNNNGLCDALEWANLTGVHLSMKVTARSSSTDFRAEAELRNVR